MQIFGVVDEPVGGENSDTLGLSKHSRALVRFIEQTQTPITIGVQGEWGSGKTSLLQAIECKLEANENVKQIWINVWEHSLLQSPEESLIGIIQEIITGILSADDNLERKEKIMKAASLVFKGALRVGSHVTMGVSGAKMISDLEQSQDNNVAALRSSLNELITKVCDNKTNPYDKIVIYIDDLDRIEPINAVKILELLKNIFSLDRCVFLLAIDYQVVVKGLKGKFGEQTEENEWEFRAFFDKIIQLPFMMPLGSYDIGNFIKNIMNSMGSEYASYAEIQSLDEIIRYTIGKNPRAIKRLINSICLITVFNAENDFAIDVKDKASEIILTLLCFQIAYPDIYDILIADPNIGDWDDEFCYEITNGKEAGFDGFADDFERAKSIPDFDEIWKQSVFRVCYAKPRYRAKAVDIVRSLSVLKNTLADLGEEDGPKLLASILQQTAITSVASTDRPSKSDGVWKSEEEKNEACALWSLIAQRLQGRCEIFSRIRTSTVSHVVRISAKGFPETRFVISQTGQLALHIAGPDVARNLEIFDFLEERKSEIAAVSGLNLHWKRSAAQKRQSIIVEHEFLESFSEKFLSKGSGVPDRAGWDDFAEWLSVWAPRFEAALLEKLGEMSSASKQ